MGHVRPQYLLECSSKVIMASSTEHILHFLLTTIFISLLQCTSMMANGRTISPSTLTMSQLFQINMSVLEEALRQKIFVMDTIW